MDILLLAILIGWLLLGTIRGFKRGALRELFSMGIVAVSLMAALLLKAPAEELLEAKFPDIVNLGNVGGYVLVFLLFYLILVIIWAILTKIEKLPFIRQTNKVVGAILGFVKNLIIIWVIFLGIKAFSWSEWGASMIESIESNAVLSLFYNYNLVEMSVFPGLKYLIRGILGA